ncbi:hypothetical protein VNI00_010820 [Paramarasmius palmivorus]|uniref:Uncharacterized protein n=1 Tax=Paramarasmius palmivorus TaxID=297713 RepID=A0AAW0CEW4_9AGAR
MFNNNGDFNIHGGAFNYVQGGQHNHIAGDMNSYRTENHGNYNVTNNGAYYTDGPRRAQRRPPPARRFEFQDEDEEEYYNSRDLTSNFSSPLRPPRSMGYVAPVSEVDKKAHEDNEEYSGESNVGAEASRHGPFSTGGAQDRLDEKRIKLLDNIPEPMNFLSAHEGAPEVSQTQSRGLQSWILSGNTMVVNAMMAQRYLTIIPVDAAQGSPEASMTAQTLLSESPLLTNTYSTSNHGDGSTSNNGSILAYGESVTQNFQTLSLSFPNQPSSTARYIPPDCSSRGQHYTRLMLTAGEGYPFWCPQPGKRKPPLPEAYRRTGIRIGDIGIIHTNKPFDFLFNITVPKGDPTDPINERVPKDFTPVSMTDPEFEKDERPENDYIGGPTHSWEPTVLVNEGYNFSSTLDEAALLILPEGSSREELTSIDIFRRFAVTHGKRWIDHARDDRHRDVCGLYLITAREQCSAWGMASQLRRRYEDSVTLSFIVHANATYGWNSRKGCELKAFPESQGGNIGERSGNQTVFVRGYRITKSTGLKAWVRTVDVQNLPGEGGGQWGPGNTFPGTSGSSNSSPNGSGSRAAGSQGNGSQTGSGFHSHSLNMSSRAIFGKLTHPCDVINTLLHAIAEKDSDGEKWDGIAISHDDDWIRSTGNASAPLSPYNVHEFLEEVLKNVSFTLDREHGAIYTVTERSNEPSNTQPLEYKDIIDEVAKEVIGRYCTWFSEGNDQALLIMDTPTPLAHISTSLAAVA